MGAHYQDRCCRTSEQSLQRGLDSFHFFHPSSLTVIANCAHRLNACAISNRSCPINRTPPTLASSLEPDVSRTVSGLKLDRIAPCSSGIPYPFGSVTGSRPSGSLVPLFVPSWLGLSSDTPVAQLLPGADATTDQSERQGTTLRSSAEKDGTNANLGKCSGSDGLALKNDASVTGVDLCQRCRGAKRRVATGLKRGSCRFASV